jgi:hypothetical protein
MNQFDQSMRASFWIRIAPVLSICLWLIAILSLALNAKEGLIYIPPIVIIISLIIFLVNIYISSLAKKTNKILGNIMLFLSIAPIILAALFMIYAVYVILRVSSI